MSTNGSAKHCPAQRGDPKHILCDRLQTSYLRTAITSPSYVPSNGSVSCIGLFEVYIVLVQHNRLGVWHQTWFKVKWKKLVRHPLEEMFVRPVVKKSWH
jgi:hypothetical protein